ncbi:hypothetical protein ACRRTK_002373 [Alexandromys fortis]
MKAMRKTINDVTEWSVVIVEDAGLSGPENGLEQHGLLPAVSASKKEQRTRLKRHLDQGLIKNMAVAPKFYKHGKKLAGVAEHRNGQGSAVHKREARSHKVPQEVHNATKQDSVVAVLEWLRKLEAAEALLALKNSSQDPCDSASLQHLGSMPGHLPGASVATLAHSSCTSELCSSEFESSNDYYFLMESQPADDYTLHGHDNADQINNVMCTQTNDVANQQGLEVNTQLPESKEMRSEVFRAESVLGIWSSETHIHMEEQKKGKRKVTFGSVEQEFGMFPSRHRVLQWTDNRQRNKQTNKQNTYVSVELAEKPCLCISALGLFRRSLLEKGDIPEDRASSQPGPSKHTGYAQAPQALARPLQRAPISGLPGGLAIAPEPLRTMEQQDTVDVACGPSDSECNMGNETGAPLVIGPGLRGRGLQTTVAEAAVVPPESRPEPQNQKLKWVSAYVPPTWNVAWRTRLEPHAESNLASEDMQAAEAEVPMVAPGPRPAFSPAPYMTTTLGQQLTALPSMVLHEAFALSNPCLDKTLLPCSSMEYHPPETQVPAENFGLQNVGQEEEPVASDQATVSATVECEEILQAAAALMTLKNSSWIWRQTHS